MKTPYLFLVAALTAQLSPGQTESGSLPDNGILANPFISSNAEVPQGFKFDIAGASPVYGDFNVPVYARTNLSIAGVLQVGYSNEGYIGNLIGLTRACPGWDAKIQILRQREELPSVALWIRGTIGWQKEELGANDLWWKVPANNFFHVLWTHYEFSSTAAGITLKPGLGEDVSLNLSIGYRELESRTLWIISMIYPGYGDTYRSPASDRAYLLEGSANLMIRALPQLAVIMQAGTLPYYKLDQDAMRLDLGRTYLAAAGLRYSLPLPVSVEGYVKWHANVNGQTDTQIRLGLSSELNLN